MNNYWHRNNVLISIHSIPRINIWLNALEMSYWDFGLDCVWNSPYHKNLPATLGMWRHDLNQTHLLYSKFDLFRKYLRSLLSWVVRTSTHRKYIPKSFLHLRKNKFGLFDLEHFLFTHNVVSLRLLRLSRGRVTGSKADQGGSRDVSDGAFLGTSVCK